MPRSAINTSAGAPCCFVREPRTCNHGASVCKATHPVLTRVFITCEDIKQKRHKDATRAG